MVAKKDLLKTYRERRNLRKSPEPSGAVKKTTKSKKPIGAQRRTIFVIQKHDASHLHYDFRLEIDGVLVSWAVPKGLSTDPSQKRLAIQTDDHPMEYANFEGVIPEGSYGAGTVMVWDAGTYENIKHMQGALVSMGQCLKNGQIEVVLHGTKLHGAYALIKTRLGQAQKSQWLLMKMKDEFADARRNLVTSEPNSVLTGKTLAQIAHAPSGKKRVSQRGGERDPIKVGKYAIELRNRDKILFPQSKITKGELVDYYIRIADTMLPYVKNRPLTMMRFPNGIGKEGFYQKDAGDYFPDWIARKPITKQDDGLVNYVVCNNAATLVYIANQGSITQHVWLSRIDKLDYPDKLIFDLDPSGNNFSLVRAAAKKLKKLLEDLGLVPFVMTTGSRGLHVVVPLKRTENFDTVRAFARDVAESLVRQDSEHLTIEMRKEKRGTKIFIDFLRNAYGQTGVAPYSVRAKEDAPVAAPLKWPEVDKSSLRSDSYTIKNIFTRLGKVGDPWQGMMHSARSIKLAHKKLQKLSTQ